MSQTEEIAKTIAQLSVDTIRDALKQAQCKSQGAKNVLVKNYESGVLDVGIEVFVNRMSDDLVGAAAKIVSMEESKLGKDQTLKQGLTEAVQSQGLPALLGKADDDVLKKLSGALGLEDEAGDYARKIEDEVMLIGMEGFLKKLNQASLKKHCAELKLAAKGNANELVERLMVHIFELEPLSDKKDDAAADGGSSSGAGAGDAAAAAPAATEEKEKEKEKDKDKEEAKPKETKKKAEPKAKKETKAKKDTSKKETSKKESKKDTAAAKASDSAAERPKRGAASSSAGGKRKAEDDEEEEAKEEKPAKKAKKEAAAPKEKKEKKEAAAPKEKEATPKKDKNEKKEAKPKAEEKKAKGAPKARQAYVSPPLSTIVKGKYTAAEFHNKFNLTDLIKYCKQEGLKASGQKKNIIKAIVAYVDTGKKDEPKAKKPAKKAQPKKKASGGSKKKAPASKAAETSSTESKEETKA